MELPNVVVLTRQSEIKEHLGKIIAQAEVGYEGTLSFNASGYSVKLICYHNTGNSKMFPEPKSCSLPTKAPQSSLDVWYELWTRAGAEHPTYDTAELYLGALEEYGLLMSMGYDHPFDHAAAEFKNLFCFTDGHIGFFVFLKYDAALRIEEDE